MRTWTNRNCNTSRPSVFGSNKNRYIFVLNYRVFVQASYLSTNVLRKQHTQTRLVSLLALVSFRSYEHRLVRQQIICRNIFTPTPDLYRSKPNSMRSLPQFKTSLCTFSSFFTFIKSHLCTDAGMLCHFVGFVRTEVEPKVQFVTWGWRNRPTEVQYRFLR